MNWFWDNIHLKKEDRSGMLTFIIILFLILLIKYYLVVFYNAPIEIQGENLFSNIEYVNVDTPTKSNFAKPKVSKSTYKERTQKASEKSSKSSSIESKKRTILFDFDPNTISKDSLILLGMSTYAANNIQKYVNKGGRFNDASSLQKIYGMDDELYIELEPFVKIKEEAKLSSSRAIKKEKIIYSKPELALHSIDINQADTAQFKLLKGIGSVYANRIVKFRNSLGGYFSVDQIKDVWGVSDSLFITIEPYLTIDTALIQKKNINTLEKEVLVKHPYIDWKKAKAILSYKKMHGNYKSMNDFEKLHGLDQAFVDTLRQYFVAK